MPIPIHDLLMIAVRAVDEPFPLIAILECSIDASVRQRGRAEICHEFPGGRIETVDSCAYMIGITKIDLVKIEGIHGHGSWFNGSFHHEEIAICNRFR